MQTWSCVPNSHRVPFLAPAYEDQICPAASEQWELRTQPLGCSVSSITALTAIVSVASTLVFMLLIFFTLLATLRVRRYTQEGRQQGGGGPSVWVRVDHRVDGGHEREPLLPQR